MAKEIPVTQGNSAIVDDEDYDRLAGHTWYFANGYARRQKYIGNRKTHSTYMHREITGASSGEQVDHINGNRLDNRRANLRLCTLVQNNQNRKKTAWNTSGYKGVSLVKKRNKWSAHIMSNKKHYSLGYHDSPEEAAAAYDEAALYLFGEFARLNFPERKSEYTPRISSKFIIKPRSSSFRGVCWHNVGKAWVAQITYNGKVHYLGLHETETDAASAYNEAAVNFGMNHKVQAIPGEDAQ